MIKLEDILDDAIRYLRGEMDAEERAFFEELLARHPHLKEEIRFAELVRQGLEEMEAAPKKSGANTFQVRTYTGVIILLLLLIGSLLFYFWYDQNAAETTIETERNPAVIYAGQNMEHTYLHIEQGGGNSANINADRGLAISWTSDGDVVFGGTFGGKGSLDAQTFSSNGKRDILFGNYHLETGFKWVYPMGAKETDDHVQDIAIDHENHLIITGGSGNNTDFGDGPIQTRGIDDHIRDQDFFIAKYDLLGNLLWKDHAGGRLVPDQQTGINSGFAIAVTEDNDIVISGSYIGTPRLGEKELPVGGPNEDLFLTKYSSDGKVQWVETVTCDYMIYGFDLQSDNEENIYLTGSFGHHNLGKAYFGTDTLESWGGRDIYLAKYSADGELLWVRQAGSAQKTQGYDMARDLAIDQEGNCIMTGVFMGQAVFGQDTLSGIGGRDIFLAKYDANGQILWAKQAGSPQGSGPRNEQGHAIALDRNGHIFITGSFTGDALFGQKTLSTGNKSNFFLAKYAPDGEVLWADQFEGLEDFQGAAGLGIDVNDAGNVVVTGFFSGTIRIAGKKLESQGKGDFFILLFSEKGELLRARSMVAYL